ncbi:HAD domain-containing protein [Micromonospora sp. NPDC050495]|uniref:HAD domain-containing protein n=1 Tax=Micromonospora sp. NPDC050495 TaxID=3154936 RepID=UPI00340EB666
MTAGAERPLLFLDVDGPLIPIGGVPPTGSDGRAVSAEATNAWDETSNPLLSRLNPMHGDRLGTLGCELVWATTWMADANEEVAPRIGLPELPVVDWPEGDEEPSTRRLHWKTRALVAWAAGRSFVWIDDEISEADRAWVAANHPGRALLHRVDPRVGLSDPDFVAIERWLATWCYQRGQAT